MDVHDLIFVGAEPELFAVLDHVLPVRVVMRGVEAVAVVLELQVRDGAVRHDGLAVDSLGAGQIQGDRVGGGKHADVGDDGHVVFRVAVAVGRDVADDVDAVARAPVQYGLGVLGDLTVEDLLARVKARPDGVLGTDRDAAAAAGAGVMVDMALFVRDPRAVVGADLRARTAADAKIGLHIRLAVGVHGHLARARAAAHADVLERAAEARMLMTLEMRQRDENIGVHHGAADACGLAVFAAHDRDLDIVRALEPVGDDDVTAGGERGIAVEIRGIHVLQRVFAAADVERVAVGEEGLAAALLDEIGDDLGIVGAQERQIAELAEMQLDGDEFAVKIDL